MDARKLVHALRFRDREEAVRWNYRSPTASLLWIYERTCFSLKKMWQEKRRALVGHNPRIGRTQLLTIVPTLVSHLLSRN